MTQSSFYDDLLRLIYDAPFSSEGWRDVLGGLAALTGASVVSFFHYDSIPRGPNTTFSAAFGCSTDTVDRYVHQFAALDIRMPIVSRLPAGAVYLDGIDLSAEDIARSEIQNDFYHPLGLGQAMGLKLLSDDHRTSVIGMFRSNLAGTYRTVEVENARRIIPHIAHALRVQRRVESCERCVQGLTVALDAFDMAVFLVDARSRVLELNAAADSLIRRTASPLRIHSGRLVGHTPQNTDRLAAAIDRAVSGVAVEGPPMIFSLRVPQQGGQLGVMVTPTGHRTPSQGGATLALVFVNDPSRQMHVEAETLRSEFGFSAAEADVALGLLRGETADAIARRRGVSYETVRMQIKGLLSHTSTKRQTELVGLLHRSLSVLRWHASAGVD